jgi:hypothetical protein
MITDFFSAANFPRIFRGLSGQGPVSPPAAFKFRSVMNRDGLISARCGRNKSIKGFLRIYITSKYFPLPLDLMLTILYYRPVSNRKIICSVRIVFCCEIEPEHALMLRCGKIL